MSDDWRIGAPKGSELPFGEFTNDVFGGRLARLRSNLGLTQEEFADEVAQVARLTVIRWESGKVRPPSKTIHRLVEVLSFEFGIQVASDAMSHRPHEDELKRAGIRKPVSDEAYYDEACDRIGGMSEFYIAILLFGGHVSATAEEWAGNFFDGRQRKNIASLPVAFELDGVAYHWGFDVGVLMEANVLRTSLKRVRATMPDWRSELASFGELRLMLEAAYGLAVLDAEERRYGVTADEFRRAREGSIQRPPRMPRPIFESIGPLAWTGSFGNSRVERAGAKHKRSNQS